MSKKTPYAALAAGILAVSTGAIFIRLADAPPLVIAAYRVGAAALLLIPLAIVKARAELVALTPRDWKLSIAAGLFLALHFATWITSLTYTSIASSVVLVNTDPLWVALLTPFITGERTPRGIMLGIALSIAGVVLIGADDFGAGQGAWGGDLLALAGSVCAAVYLLLGRTLRQKLSLVAYVTVCYTSAAVFLWLFVFAGRLPIRGFDAQTWFFMGALAVVTQLVGHTCYNWALKWFSSGLVAVSLLGEPIGSSLLAYVIFGEQVSGLKWAGGAMILVAIYISAAAEKKPVDG